MTPLGLTDLLTTRGGKGGGIATGTNIFLGTCAASVYDPNVHGHKETTNLLWIYLYVDPYALRLRTWSTTTPLIC